MLHSARTIPKKYVDAAFLLCFAAGLWFLLWRAPYGFANSDEAFYLSVPYRLAMGDALLVDEWHLSQLAGFLLYPAMRLYLLFSAGTDGILLTFRYIYILAQSAAALYIYLRLRRMSGLGSLLAALAFYLYAPFNISALSYNSMGVMLMSSACVTAATAARHRRRDMLLSGLLFAGAVLCCPHLLLLFALYCVLALGRYIRIKRGRPQTDDALAGSSFLSFTMGAAALALVFAAFLLSRAGISDIAASIGYIMNDPEHPSIPIYRSLFTFAESLFVIHALAAPVLCCCTVLLVLALADKKRAAHRALYLLAASLLTALFYFPFILDGVLPLYYAPEQPINRIVNLLMLPLNILGLFAYILSDSREKELFFSVYIPGLLFGLCVHLSSNQRLMNIASATTVALIASIVFICKLMGDLLEAREKPRLSALAALVLAGLLLCQLSAQVFFRHSFAFWEDSCPDGLTQRITLGPEKGVLSSDGYAYVYYERYFATQAIREAPGDRVLYLTGQTWLYLADNKGNGAYSAWLSYYDPAASVQRLQEYWRLEPDKKPDCIFVGDDFPGAEEYKDMLNTYSQPPIETGRGYILGVG